MRRRLLRSDPSRRWRSAKATTACLAAIGVLVVGLPAPPAAAEQPSSPDPEGPTLAEFLAGDVQEPEADARRRVEESGTWASGRPRPGGMSPVPVRPVDRSALPELPRVSPQPVRPVEWPQPERAVLAVGDGTGSGRADGAQDIGGLPVRVTVPPSPAEITGAGRPLPAGTDLEVRVLDRATALRHGAATAVELGRAAPAGSGPAGAGVVEVSLGYAGFGHAYGGDYGSRLRLVGYEQACVAAGGECPGRPLPSGNDPVDQTVTATVSLAGDGGGTVLMLTAGEAGTAGDWSATPLSPASEWAHGGHSGHFSWSYPLRVPDLPGGLAPELSLGYSSSSVDGRTLSSNNQTSWLGEGFALEPGYVERRYLACASDMGSGANNTTKTGDLCWKSDNAVLVLGGTATELVRDSTNGAWRPKHDDGTRVQRLTGATNGARDGEYWRVTTTDGAQYHFGRHNRYSGDTAATNSVLTVPVAGNHSGEPCHASSFASSFCDQAWRWNLDYVVDPNGNTMTYFYTRETNRYGRNLNSSSVSYHRGGYLTRIEYGQRQGSEHTTPAPARVVFTVAERCLPSGTVTCQPSELTSSTADKWPDVPYDRICTSTSSCPDRVSATFFTRKRLTQVETQVRVSGSYQPVDRWTLAHAFPDPGDGNSAALWLDRITHSGRVGTAVTLPSVTFAGVAMPNRVPEIDTAPLVNRYRVVGITTETGAVVSPHYSQPDCQPGQTMPTPHTNTTRCFPVYWLPEGAEHDDPEIYWFHKYVVESVTEIDGTGGGVEVETHYAYGGSPAWAYDDSEFTKPSQRTWNEWHGYGRVTTRVGQTGTAQLRTERLYLRGMHGDREAPSGGTRTVTVADSWGDSVTDHEHFAGWLREEIVYNGSAKVTSTVHDPWRSAVTASGGGAEARMVKVAATREHTSLAAGGWRTTDIRYTYDTHGLLVQTDDRGDPATTADDLCTRTEYAKNTSAWILATTKRTETVAKQCPVTPSRPADVVSDQRRSYDGGGYGAAPTKGNVTRVEELQSWSSGPVYQTTSRSSYDSHGRVTSSWDALDRQTVTSYTPASGGPLTQLTVTNPAGHVTTTVLDPSLGVPTLITDANGRHIDANYDALGRLRQVWLTDRDRATQSPSLEYTYRVSASQPPAVTTLSLLPSGGYATSVQMYDALLRTRQSQVPAAGDTGGRLVTDTEYDSRGLVVEVKGPYYATGAPSTTLVQPATTVPRRVLSTFDGAGRVTLERLMVHQDEHSRRTTSYGGDRVHVTPPAGGTATTTIIDARGRTVHLREHHGPTPSGGYDPTSYTYTPAGEVATVTDPAGNVWTYGYDLRGRRVSVDDPDAGLATTGYDAAGQVVSSTNARGRKLFHSYDALGRLTQTRSGSATGPLVSQWVYDTLEKGQLTSSTRWVAGDPYTTTVYDYDNAYRSLGETVTIPASEGALAGSYQTFHTYNPDGSLRLHWRPGIGGLPQETLWHHYDAAGRPEWLSAARTYVADTVYSPFGQVEQYSLGVDLGRANWQTYFYQEGTRWLARVRVDREGVNPADVDRAYTYDPAGNPRSIADTGGTGSADVQCFGYDHQQRLTSAWTQATPGCAASPSAGVIGGIAPYWHSYSFDPAGNRSQLVEHGLGGAVDRVTSYTYPASGQPRPHALTGTTTQVGGGPVSTTSFSYDQAGNTTARTGPQGTTTYQWDDEGGLVGVTTPDGAGGAVHAADGSRLIRRTPTSTTLYIGGDEYTLDHGTGQLRGTRYYALGDATLVVRTADGVISSLGTDHHGTPLATINDQNGITRRWQDPYGNPRGTQPPQWPADRGFHTGTEDRWAGLVHMGARSYEPSIGRFLSVDPLINHGDSQHMHGYSYANNNPLTLTDPNGLEPRPWHDPNFKQNNPDFDYDEYWKNEQKAYGCTSNCSKSGQSSWTTGSSSSGKSSSSSSSGSGGKSSSSSTNGTAPKVVGNVTAAELYRGDYTLEEAFGLPEDPIKQCQQYGLCGHLVTPPEVLLCLSGSAHVGIGASFGLCVGLGAGGEIIAVGIDTRLGVSTNVGGSVQASATTTRRLSSQIDGYGYGQISAGGPAYGGVEASTVDGGSGAVVAGINIGSETIIPIGADAGYGGFVIWRFK
jgi:RHS repeat-associated protein